MRWLLHTKNYLSLSKAGSGIFRYFLKARIKSIALDLRTCEEYDILRKNNSFDCHFWLHKFTQNNGLWFPLFWFLSVFNIHFFQHLLYWPLIRRRRKWVDDDVCFNWITLVMTPKINSPVTCHSRNDSSLGIINIKVSKDNLSMKRYVMFFWHQIVIVNSSSLMILLLFKM